MPDRRGAARGGLPRTAVWAAVTAALALSCAPAGMGKMTLRVSSVFHPGRFEDHVVSLGDTFAIMDLELAAEVAGFLPDLSIDTTGRGVFSRSDTLRNPAAKVRILQADSLLDSCWAFAVGRMQHPSRRTALLFELVEFDDGGQFIPLPAEEPKEKD